MDDGIRKGKRNQAVRAWLRDIPQVLTLLENGQMELQGMIPWSSNYTYLTRVAEGDREMLAVYKPASGERPLWDFETGTLCNREVAAYLVSADLGWPNIPPTVLREGPMGVGAVQQFIEFKRRENFFTVRDSCRGEMQKIAAFDALINNTDRKGGHILVDESGAIWCIDHGVTFHEEPKLRTVVWDFVGEPIPNELLDSLERLKPKLKAGDPFRRRLEAMLSRSELRALDLRLGQLLRERAYPAPPDDWPHIPWPPV
ncbi:MAG: SCO1664 family protein [Anaerolineae bacterium]